MRNIKTPLSDHVCVCSLHTFVNDEEVYVAPNRKVAFSIGAEKDSPKEWELSMEDPKPFRKNSEEISLIKFWIEDFYRS